LPPVSAGIPAIPWAGNSLLPQWFTKTILKLTEAILITA
jgi:hypothetical protein